MLIPWKIPDPFLHLQSIKEQPTGYQLNLASTKTAATCPTCHCQTMKKHKRKGHTYGSIICDFVTSRIVAVLPNRQPGTISK